MTFETIINAAAAIRCLNDGQTIKQIAASAKVTESTVRRWVNGSGFKKHNGKWVFAH